MKSVLSIFAPETQSPRVDAERLFLGSAKANVGHGESVSGPIAMIKSLMMLERNEIPPHCGIKTKVRLISRSSNNEILTLPRSTVVSRRISRSAMCT